MSLADLILNLALNSLNKMLYLNVLDLYNKLINYNTIDQNKYKYVRTLSSEIR